jgi:hypothetical protein
MHQAQSQARQRSIIQICTSFGYASFQSNYLDSKGREWRFTRQRILAKLLIPIQVSAMILDR